MRGRYQLGLGEGGVVPSPEPHNSVCPGFCPDLVGVEPPGVGNVGPPGAQRVGLAGLP